MLVHCVTLKFKPSASPDQIDALVSALAALPDQIPVPMRTRQGRDLGERPTNAHYAVVSEFGNADDFAAYLVHPAHLSLPRDHVESMQSVQFLTDDDGA